MLGVNEKGGQRRISVNGVDSVGQWACFYAVRWKKKLQLLVLFLIWIKKIPQQSNHKIHNIQCQNPKMSSLGNTKTMPIKYQDISSSQYVTTWAFILFLAAINTLSKCGVDLLYLTVLKIKLNKDCKQPQSILYTDTSNSCLYWLLWNRVHANCSVNMAHLSFLP